MKSGTRRIALSAAVLSLAWLAPHAQAENGKDWATAWTASRQGAYAAPKSPAAVIPDGDFQAQIFFPQPDAIRYALPGAKASDQSFRVIVRPDRRCDADTQFASRSGLHDIAARRRLWTDVREPGDRCVWNAGQRI